MRDLKHVQTARQPKPAAVNRVKKRKEKKPRKPLNLRPFLTWGARIAGGGIAAAVAAALVYEGYLFTANTVFLPVNRIDVVKGKKLTRDEIVSLAGVKEGDDLLRLDLRRMGEHLEKNPWVRSVRVKRFFPHSLYIEVAEREPVAVVNMGYLYYLDSRGEVFKPLTEGDSLDFPVVTGVSEEDLNGDPKGTREALKRAAELVALLREGKDIRLEEISEVHYDKGFGFTLFTTQGGVPVKLGIDGFGDKLARFARIYGDLKTHISGLEYIDLNYADKIVVKKV